MAVGLYVAASTQLPKNLDKSWHGQIILVSFLFG